MKGTFWARNARSPFICMQEGQQYNVVRFASNDNFWPFWLDVEVTASGEQTYQSVLHLEN